MFAIPFINLATIVICGHQQVSPQKNILLKT